MTAAIRVRTSANATCDAFWNQRVTTMPGGSTTSATTPEAPVEEEQAADRRDERERVDDERRQSLVEHVRERVDVARQARDDPARLLLREVAERERGEVLEEVAAQVEHDLLADPGEHEPGRRPEHPGRQRRRRCTRPRRRVSRVGSPALMPLSIASPTISQPTHGCGGRDRGDHHHAADPPTAALGVAPRGARDLCGAYAARASSPKRSVKAPPRRIRSCGSAVLDDATVVGARPRGRRRGSSRGAGPR